MTMIKARARARRGAALLLVLVALAIGLLLVATWLDGRRESVPVAQRVSASTVARFAAASGVDLAIATLDAEDDWREAVDDGRFDEPLALDGAECSFTVVDADTDERPHDDTIRLRITCTAVADQIVSTDMRIVPVETADPVLDLGLGETAIVVERTLRIEDEAALLPWVARPGSVGGPLVVGSLDGRLDAVVVADDAVALDTKVLEVDGRGDENPSRGVRRLPDPIPGIAAPVVPTADPDDTMRGRAPVDLTIAPGNDLVSERVRMPGGARIVFEEDRVIHALGDIVIDHGAQIRVERGTLVLDARRDLRVQGGEIVVAEGARLLLRAGREMRFADAVVVPEAVDPDAAAHEFPPLDGTGVDAIVVTTDGGDATIEIGGRSALALVVVAPDGSVVVEDDAVLHGRIVAAEVDLRHRATVYARPDDGRVVGLTQPIGPHRDEDGALLEEIADADFGTDAGLATVAATTGMEVVSLDGSATPDPETAEQTRESFRERIRRKIEERRQQRDQRRRARGGRDRW